MTQYADLEVSPTDDTYVMADAPDTNFGRAPTLYSDGNPRQESFLRFFITHDGPIARARLRLYATDGSSNGPALYATHTDWAGYDMTWNLRPAPLGPPLGDVGQIHSGSLVEYDVTSHVTGQGPYSFLLKPDVGDGVDFVSSEVDHAYRRPKLLLTVATGAMGCHFRGTAGAIQEVRPSGSPENDEPRVMAMDAAGGYALAGSYSGTNTLGGPTFQGTGLMVGRFNADGSHQWTRALPQTNAFASVQGIAITPLGNVLVMGSFTGQVDLGNGPLPEDPTRGPGIFIAKFSPTGQYVWSRTFQAPVIHRNGSATFGTLVPNGIATDAQGSLLLTGHFTGAMDLGGGTLDAGDASRQDSGSRQGLFLVKFSWEGEHRWSLAHAAGLGSTKGLTVATDSQGNVLLGGVAGGNNALGATTVDTPFVARYSPTGQLQWVRLLTGTAGTVMGIAPLPGDAVAFTASFTGAFSFAGTPVANPLSTPDLLMGTLEPTGEDRWARAAGGTGVELPQRLVADAQGNLVVMGFFSGETDLGGGLLNASDRYAEYFVAKYQADGAHRWSRTLSEPVELGLLGMTPSGETLVGGTFLGPIEVDGALYTPSGMVDGLMLRLKP